MARKIAIEEGRPCLIEGMTYRIGAHSTSDDDSKYRRSASPEEGYDSERSYWDARSPIIRFGGFLESHGLWTAEEEAALRKTERARSIKALNEAEKVAQPHLKHLFTDVYDDMPWMLQEQQAALKAHLIKYKEHYMDVPDEHVESL